MNFKLATLCFLGFLVLATTGFANPENLWTLTKIDGKNVVYNPATQESLSVTVNGAGVWIGRVVFGASGGTWTMPLIPAALEMMYPGVDANKLLELPVEPGAPGHSVMFSASEHQS